MGKAFLHNRTGGGSELNFKVVGNPQPSSPKENTIWLNTDTAITGWYFSADEPNHYEEGIVWIRTEASSVAAFNVLKKNGVQVYPVSAKQCIGGSYVDKDAIIYQNGGWVALGNAYYFESGKGSSIGDWALLKQAGAGSSNYVSMTNEYILFQCGSGNYNALLTQSPAVNLTGVRKLYFDAEFPKQNCTLGIADQPRESCYDPSFVATVDASKKSRQTFELDVSGYNGLYYIAAFARDATGSGKIYNVWRG